MTRRRALTGLAGAAALIAVITVLSRLLGFGRWLTQSYAVGATSTGTAYATANLMPNVLFEVVAGGALAGAIVPLLAGPLARGLRQDVDRTASALLTWAVVILLPASVLLAVMARPLVELLVTAGPAAQDAAVTAARTDLAAATAASTDLAARLLVVFAPQVVLYGISVVLTGVLQAQRRFGWPAAAPLASSVVVITSYLMFRRLAGVSVDDPQALSPDAVAWLAWGTTAGVAAMSLPLIVPVLRSGVRLRPTLGFPEGVGRRARHLALAGFGGLVAQQAAVVTALVLANRNGGSGTINLFQYAQAVYFLPYAVLAVPLATAAFPRLAEHAATGDVERYARLVSVSTRAVLLVSAAGAAVLVAAAPAATAVFAALDASGEPRRVAAMTSTLTLLAPGLLGYALIFQLSRVLFARERGRLAVWAVVAGWTTVVLASIVAVLVLAPEGGDQAGTLAGLAIGSTVGMVVGGAALLAGVVVASGRAAVAGVPRTLLVTAVGAVGGSVLGRRLVDATLGTASGPEVSEPWIAVAAGVVGALVACLCVLGATLVGDRRTVSAALRSERGADDGSSPAGRTGVGHV